MFELLFDGLRSSFTWTSSKKVFISDDVRVSGKIAEILLNNYDVPVVTDVNIIEKVIGKKVEFIGTKEGMPGNGWYTRVLGGHNHDKILLGRPKI